MKKYTLGFIFNKSLCRVALMEKERPLWQKGKLNGIGGKIEANETSAACIVRETREESGLESKEKDWLCVANLSGMDWSVDVYALVHDGNEKEVATKTDEKVGWYEIAALPKEIISNIPWLVGLAVDKIQNKKISSCKVTYSD